MAQGETRGWFSWGRAVLVVSLAVNLLVAGVIAGAFWHERRGEARGPGLRDAGFGPYAAALPPGDRIALAMELRREGGPFLTRRDEMRAAFDAVLRALRAEPYDHGAVEAILAQQGQAVRATQETAQTLLLAHIAQMSAKDRLAYAEALTQWRRIRGGKPNRAGP
ncbi:MAG: periplasmic heavy metal sensor [Pseudomonadota bacterium]